MDVDANSDLLGRELSIEVDGTTLRCALSGAPVDDDAVSWTLHRGDFHPSRASQPVVAGAGWTVKLPDRTNGYAVRAVVDGVVYQSKWTQLFGSDAKLRYDEWRKSAPTPSDAAPRPIPLFRYEKPFENIGFVCHRGDQSGDLAEVAETNALVIEHHQSSNWGNLALLSGSGSSRDKRGTHFVFSGITRDSDRLIFGSEDVKSQVPDIRTLADGLGEFHLLTWDDEQIYFGHDYIGQGHLFIYEDDNIVAGANGIHLLALMLRAVGVPLRLNDDVVKLKFFSTSYPFEFHQGRRTDFAGVERISVYESARVDAGGLSLSKTEMWTDNADGELSDALYEDLLAKAVEEITDNVAIALKHPKFENVVAELSAGLDSRIIYCALSRLPRSEKVRISTRTGKEEPTAAAINAQYGFAWDDLPRRYSFHGAPEDGDFPLTSHSVFMDGYYIESMFKVRAEYEKPTLVLTGHGGEAFSRVMSIEGFFARDFSGEIPGPVETEAEIESNVIRFIGNHQVWYAAGDRYFSESLSEMLAESPSGSLAKRFADTYVSERNPFVGGSVYRGAMSGPQWRPLHSKSLYRLRALWFQRKQDYRLQYDLIRALNPLISEVPYMKPVEDAYKAEFHKYRPPFKLTEPIQFDEDVSSVRAARRSSESGSVWLPSREDFDATRRSVDEYQESAESFLAPLRYILDSHPEYEDMGLPLFSYIERVVNRTNPRAFSKRHNIRNKLHILMQEILLSSKMP
ncbi:hypothetical protein GCM10009860_09630 [Microbacterium mitrae]|uniref:Asparagine synthetase domain-containing protein n=1 Tax=Microbacterium mitrae TaxID=664640 RepID=A0A5C8HQL7_9MICO|nr:hypothetical protein [Microbacterium mitrae]TXK06305.1 hypothetical protein FVP60_04920 [Microbacterium mitrae]